MLGQTSYKFISLSLFSALIISGCSQKQQHPTPNPVEGGQCIIAGVEAPLWACGSYSEDSRYVAVGSAPISKLGHDFSRREALANARSNLVNQIKLQVKNKTESYMRSTGQKDQEAVERVVTMVSKQTADLTLRDSKQISYWENKGDNSIYLLVAIDKAKVDSIIDNEIKNGVGSGTQISNSTEALKDI